MIQIKGQTLALPIWGAIVHFTETVDWDLPKGNLSWFVRMSQDHTFYNVSIVDVDLRGVDTLTAMADILSETGMFLGTLNLQQVIMRYVKLPDGQPLCAKLSEGIPRTG